VSVLLFVRHLDMTRHVVVAGEILAEAMTLHIVVAGEILAEAMTLHIVVAGEILAEAMTLHIVVCALVAPGPFAPFGPMFFFRHSLSLVIGPRNCAFIIRVRSYPHCRSSDIPCVGFPTHVEPDGGEPETSSMP
jgi:hypothetical protein